MANGNQSSTVISAQSLGIGTEKPKFPQYAILDKRLGSFRELPWLNTCPVSVQHLAEAGLVNTGEGVFRLAIDIVVSHPMRHAPIERSLTFLYFEWLS